MLMPKMLTFSVFLYTASPNRKPVNCVFHLSGVWHYYLPTNTYKKLIRRWDSERELFTTTSYTYFKLPKREPTSFSKL